MSLRTRAKSLLLKLERTSRDHLRPESEVIYQNIFERDISRLGLDFSAYPLGFAANYGLMYLVLRCVISFDLEDIVELGGGQTSYLLDALVGAGKTAARVTTVESDPFWAEAVQSKVRHRVELAQFKEATNRVGRFRGYDFNSVSLPDSIDLLVVDGPPGAALGGAYARHAALELCGRMNSEGYVVIIDDAERPGEAALAELMLEQLPASRKGVAVAAKKQIVLAGGRAMEAAFF